MLLKTFQLTVRNFRNVGRLVSVESCVIVPVQNYGRYAPRKARIVNEDELFDVDIDHEAPTPTPRTVKEPKPKKYKAGDTKECNESMSKGFHTVLENEKLMSSIMTSLKSKKARKKQEQILLEGARLIEDALKAKLTLETLIFSRYEDVKHLPIPEKTKMYKVPYRSIQLWSTLTTSPGIMGIFKKPSPLHSKKNALPITIICDNVRDPGNMGSILRAAAGVGVEKVILTKGCVDFWDPKVVRSAAGAHFHIAVHSSVEWDVIKTLINEEAQVYVADNASDVYTEIYDETPDKSNSIEAEGEQEDVKEVEAKEEDYLEKIKKKKNLKEKLLQAEHAGSAVQLYDVPIVPYFAVDYTPSQVVLIVGGETKGISAESYKLIKSRQGLRVNIPLDNGVESLNSGMALGVIAFEMKKQFLSVQNKMKQQQAQ